MSDSEVFLSLQVWVRYTGGFEQVSTCQVSTMKQWQNQQKKVRKLMYTLMLLHTYKPKKIR